MKLPQITIADWLKAEETVRFKPDPQPKGSVTVEQYAEIRNLSSNRSQAILIKLCRAGLAKRQRWRSGANGCRQVYWLIKK